MDLSYYLFIPWKRSRAVERFFDSCLGYLRGFSEAHESFGRRGSSPVMIFEVWLGMLAQWCIGITGGFIIDNNSIKISIKFDPRAYVRTFLDSHVMTFFPSKFCIVISRTAT